MSADGGRQGHDLVLNLQYLRFIAAALVVLDHGVAVSSRFIEHGQQFHIGAIGVDIFFIISGFIMVYITSNGPVSTRSFFLGRIGRVGPPYWIMNFALAAVIMIMPTLMPASKLDPVHFTLSNLFIAAPHPVHDIVSPFMLVGWTLNYEFLFYSLFALAMAFSHKWRAELVAVVFFLFALAGVLLPLGPVGRFYTDPIVLEFAMGIAIALFCRKIQVGAPVAAILLVLGVAGVIANGIYLPYAFYWDRLIYWGVPSMLIVAAAVFLDRRGLSLNSPGLRLLGDASYSIYLTHFAIVHVAVRMLGRIPALKGDVWLSSAILLAASVAGGVAFHLLVEKPAIRMFRRLVGRLKARPASSGVQPPLPS